MRFTIKPKDKCPCGSGKEYRKCHSPKRDKSEDNLWKGPGFQQAVYFGHKEPLTGIWFDKTRKGEFVLLRHEDRIPVARFFCVDTTILACKAIVRFLSISLSNGKITYSGSLEIKGAVKHSIPIIVGCLNVELVESFNVNLSGGSVPYERGNWVIFIGEDENPIARIKKEPQWLRLLRASGFLVEAGSPGEINFELTMRSKGYNLCTLALPFSEIEIPHPQIAVEDNPATCQLEIEDESVSWALVLHQQVFSEKKRSRKDSKVLLGYKRGIDIEIEDFDRGVRKPFLKPMKLRIGVSLPEQSHTLGKFSDVLQRIIRTISEDRGFRFIDEQTRILEADFRDHVLTVLKSMGYFAFAEPSRRGGFIDILLKKGDSEAIIEFKVWGRRKYKDVIKQVLDYGTPWTTEYATVMINPNKDSIVEKFIENAKRSPGYKHISDDDSALAPLNMLTSCHYLRSWEKHIVVTHFVINTTKL